MRMENYRLKIKNLSSAKKEIDRLKNQGKKIVFTNGCFDILHSGHARYLYAARDLGDYLIVGVNSDRSVREIKEEGRPIIPEIERAEMLAALGCVDSVVIFDEDTPYNIIKHLMPEILVKGGDWEKDDIVGSDLVEGSGGVVKRIPYVSGYSTTEIIEKIRNLAT
jgi:rfaE bifunctional protein nucleotidyltransferase chain/domain